MTFYVKNNGVWVNVIDAQVRTSVAWTPVQEGWVRESGIWQRFYLRDTAIPAQPFTDITELATGFDFTITDNMLGNNVSTVSYSGSGGGESFSVENQDFAPGSTYTYTWAITPQPSTTYTFTAYFTSATGYQSTPIVKTVNIPATTNYYQAYIDPVSSNTWEAGSTDAWLGADKPVEQGGTPQHKGCWFYGDRTDRFWGLTVTKMQIRISRLNTAHGVAGLGNVWLGHHDNKTRPDNQPNILDDTKVGELRRGEAKWFDVPSSWLSAFKNKNANYRGFGLNTSSSSDVNNIKTFSSQTDTLNGRLYVEWHD